MNFDPSEFEVFFRSKYIPLKFMMNKYVSFKICRIELSKVGDANKLDFYLNLI